VNVDELTQVLIDACCTQLSHRSIAALNAPIDISIVQRIG